MLTLGIDPGSNATGYGIVESRGGGLRAIAYGTIVPPRGLPFLDRLPHLAAAIAEIVAGTRPESAAVEDIFHARNSRVALQLGHVRGAALLPLLRAGIAIHAYPTRLVKKAVAGYGGADKDQVRRMVRLLLGLRDAPLGLDASDALAVAICHVHAAGNSRLQKAARV